MRNSEKQNKRPPFALPTLKQLLGEVFCDIQNNEGRGKVLSAELKLLTLMETFIIPEFTKTEPNTYFIAHCFKENIDKHSIAWSTV